VNPGMEVGMDIEPHIVTEMLTLISQGSTKN
jgi:hypothetical protein